MKFLRHLLEITKLDKEKDQRIREKMGAQNKVKEIKQYQKKWLQHVQRMDINRLPKQALQYKPKGRRNVGRPRKRWRDQLHFEDQGTGNTPKPSRTWSWWWYIRIYELDNIKITKIQQISNHMPERYLCIQSHTRTQLHSSPYATILL